MRWPTPLLRLDPNAHKNDFGHVLVMAGSSSMLGAAALVGLSAMRTGAGLVTCAVPKALNLALQKKLSPVVMTLPYAAFGELEKSFPKFDALAIGPGLGRSLNIQRSIYKVISRFTKPMVIDADALNAIAQKPEVLLKIKPPKVLTPHPGEMARLIGRSRAYVEKNRKAVALSFARRYNCVLLLKGQHTIVASPKGDVYINTTGNVGMATAGSGDVLTGMIAALLAQGVPPFEAAVFGAWLHGKAGDRAFKKNPVGMIATDILDQIRPLKHAQR